METINPTIIHNYKFYESSELMKINPKFFKGCRTGREFIKKNSLEIGDFVYAAWYDNDWIFKDPENNNSRKTDRVFFSDFWVDECFPKEVGEIIEIAPDIIELKDKEKLQDTYGNIIEVEVRGKREENKCYFKVHDVAKGFKMENLCASVTDDRNLYIKDLHYKYFNCINEFKTKIIGKNNRVHKKQLFLTHEGLIRVLFVSKNDEVKKFVKWASEILYTARMGTKQQKHKLISKLTGVDVESVRDVFSKTASKLSVIYLINLGLVKDLRKIFNIPIKFNDDDQVSKGGRTIGFDRRLYDHLDNYGKLPGVKMNIMWYSLIDPIHTKKAESDLLTTLGEKGYRLENLEYKELIIYKPGSKDLKIIKDVYNTVANKYMGHLTEAQAKMTELKNQIIQLDNEMKVIKLESENKLMKIINNNEKEITNLKNQNKIDKLENENKILKLENELRKANAENKTLKKKNTKLLADN